MPITYALDPWPSVMGYFIYTKPQQHTPRGEAWEDCRTLGEKYGIKQHHWHRCSSGYVTGGSYG